MNVAFYLPQFHAIPENDAWWGKGFTEWTNVKRSKPCYLGHHQPEVPLNGEYYDLSDVTVMEKQSEMAQRFGIDAFCYYHYWFDGKLLLEKPLENMLADPKVSIPFMICWANESWARTWDGADEEYLIKQNYEESESGWIKHFDYLLAFFKDSRYVKIDNKPVMILYKPHLINEIDRMMDIWNRRAKEEGFDGLYWGVQHHSAFDHPEKLTGFDFGIEFEPFYTVREQIQAGKYPTALQRFATKCLHLPMLYSYDQIWQRMIGRDPVKNGGLEMAPGAFTAWDNTPRRGKKATVFHRASPEKFEKYLREKMTAAKERYHVPFLFINAWNEWAEGAHLEPDELNQYGYLEAVKRVSGEKK